jgi:hypothetical protein
VVENAIETAAYRLIPVLPDCAILSASLAGRALATNVRWVISRAIGVVRWRAAVQSNRPVEVLLALTGVVIRPAATVPFAPPSKPTSIDRRGKGPAYIAD